MYYTTNQQSRGSLGLSPEVRDKKGSKGGLDYESI